MPIIEQVGAREILDSRGNPTVEVEVALTTARSRAPRSRPARRPASTRPSSCATAATATAARASRRPSRRVLDEIAPAVIGLDADDQRLVDQALLDLDGTPDKSRLGANAILGRVAGGRQGRRRLRRACRCSATSAARTRTSCRCR